MSSNLLRDRFEEIERIARSIGLDPYDVHFFEVPADIIYQVASYGLPTRYSHWSFGSTYSYQKSQGEMGHSKIYELVLNNDPSFAFLDDSNTDTTNLLICAHCYLPDTYVQTASGIKLIQDISSEDSVFTYTGKLSKVVHPTSRFYHGNVITIQSGSYKFSQTEDHLLYAIKTNPLDRTKARSWTNAFAKMDYQPQWIKSSQLNVGDFLIAKKPKLPTGKLCKISIPINKVHWKSKVVRSLDVDMDEHFGELVGLYLAEGYARPKGQMGLCFSGDEIDLHRISSSLIRRYFKLTPRVKFSKKQNAATVEFNEICIANFLREKLGTSCYFKRVPTEWMAECSCDFLRGVLKGFLLGDGNTSEEDSIGFGTTSSILAMQIQQIAMHFGIYFGINPRDKSAKSQPRSMAFEGYAFGIYDNRIRKIIGLEERVRSRIYSGIIENQDCFYLKIHSIRQREYNGMVHCMRVQENDSFSLANGIVTHNCLAHSDFFKNNIMFRNANETNMIQIAKQHASTIDQYRRDYGDDEVDKWLDIALSLERHIDVYKGRYRTRYPQRYVDYIEHIPTKWEDIVHEHSKPRMLRTIKGQYLPPYAEKDILWFLSEYGNLEEWQQNIFDIVRRESYYFFPQYKTKTLNEGWACVSANTRIHTSSGFIRAYDIVNGNGNEDVFSGELFEKRSDTHTTQRRDGFQIRTNSALVFSCAKKHKVMLSDGTFVTADKLKIGDKLKEANIHTWHGQTQIIENTYIPSKYSNGKTVNFGKEIIVDEDLARFVAFWLGEGSQSKDRNLNIRNADKKILELLGAYVKNIFGINYSIERVNDDGTKRYNLWIYSRALFELMHSITGCVTCTAKDKSVPDCIFKSPKSVVIAFLRSVFDAEGCVYLNESKKQRTLIYASSSIDFISEIALLLHSFGVYGSYNRTKKKGYEDGYQLRISDKRSLINFYEKIGCNDVKKSRKLKKLIKSINTKSHWCKIKDYALVKEIHPIKDVFYDFTMPKTHQYVANGLVHHNSFFHAEIMHQYAMGDDNEYGVKNIKYHLTSEEHLDFMSAHEKVVQPGLKIPLKVEVQEQDAFGQYTGRKIKTWNPILTQRPELFSSAIRLNPYYVGYRILIDVKKRWDEYYKQGYMEDEMEIRHPVTINGLQKIFEIRANEDDLSFFRNYLTNELCDELHLFSFGNSNEYKDDYGYQDDLGDLQQSSEEIDENLSNQLIANKTILVRSKGLKDILSTYASMYNNYGVPNVVIRRVDADGMLRLEHSTFDGVNLDIGYAEQVLRAIWAAWGRPVEIIRKDRLVGKTRILRFDGRSFKVDYNAIDYPENVELAESMSSW